VCKLPESGKIPTDTAFAYGGTLVFGTSLPRVAIVAIGRPIANLGGPTSTAAIGVRPGPPVVDARYSPGSSVIDASFLYSNDESSRSEVRYTIHLSW
jgi:hypothetical protein